MSIRATSEIIAEEILDGWFETEMSEKKEDVDAIHYLKKNDK